jgi:hypothetical protein
MKQCHRTRVGKLHVILLQGRPGVTLFIWDYTRFSVAWQRFFQRQHLWSLNLVLSTGITTIFVRLSPRSLSKVCSSLLQCKQFENVHTPALAFSRSRGLFFNSEHMIERGSQLFLLKLFQTWTVLNVRGCCMISLLSAQPMSWKSSKFILRTHFPIIPILKPRLGTIFMQIGLYCWYHICRGFHISHYTEHARSFVTFHAL